MFHYFYVQQIHYQNTVNQIHQYSNSFIIKIFSIQYIVNYPQSSNPFPVSPLLTDNKKNKILVEEELQDQIMRIPSQTVIKIKFFIT